MNSMGIKTLLQHPLAGINSNNAQEKFAEIAQNLFNNFCIKCGEKRYYFAEVEFYYYDSNGLTHEWNKVTYKRKQYKVGDLFYHLSGVDVCFDSDEDRYGGILIRSVVDEYDEVTVGPLKCVYKMLNDCNGKQMPQIVPIPVSEKRKNDPKSTYRYLGKADFDLIGMGNNKESTEKNKDGDLKLAFYDSTIDSASWNKARSSYYSNRLVKYK